MPSQRFVSGEKKKLLEKKKNPRLLTFQNLGQERMWNSTAQEATERDPETESETEIDTAQVLVARRRVAQVLASRYLCMCMYTYLCV